MSRGKNINMFLMEGDVTSSIKCGSTKFRTDEKGHEL